MYLNKTRLVRYNTPPEMFPIMKNHFVGSSYIINQLIEN